MAQPLLCPGNGAGLNEYLHEIDEQAAELMEITMARLADERGITPVWNCPEHQ